MSRTLRGPSVGLRSRSGLGHDPSMTIIRRKASSFVLTALLLLCAACGKTQVKIANSTGVTLTQVTVSVYGTGSSNTLIFSNVANAALAASTKVRSRVCMIQVRRRRENAAV